MTSPPTPPEWIGTQATCTACRFQAGASRALAFGLPTPRFRIAFTYRAQGRRFSGTFGSATAIPQNQQFPILYNPLDPQQNSKTHSPTATSGSRSPLIAVGIAGSVILSIAWLLVLRSCAP